MNAYLPDLYRLPVETLLPGCSGHGPVYSRGWIAEEPFAEVKQPDFAEVKQPDSAEVELPDSAEVKQPDSAEVELPDSAEVERLDSAEVKQPDSAEVKQPDAVDVKLSDSFKLELSDSAQMKLSDPADGNTSTDFFITPLRFGYIQLKAGSCLSADFLQAYCLVYCMYGCGQWILPSSSAIGLAVGDIFFFKGTDGLTMQARQDLEISLLVLTGRMTAELYRAASNMKNSVPSEVRKTSPAQKNALPQISRNEEGQKASSVLPDERKSGPILRASHAIAPFLCFTQLQFPDFEQRQFVIMKNFFLRQGQETAEGNVASYDLPCMSKFTRYTDFDSPCVSKSIYRTDFDFSCHMDRLLTRLVLLNCTDTEDKPGKTLIMQILTYLQEHFQENISIEEVAAQFGFSVSHFRRIFREEMHMAPKAYLTKLRMQHAAGELLSTDKSMEEIAQDSGFHTAAHFASTFRNAYGMSPLQYRSRMTRK